MTQRGIPSSYKLLTGLSGLTSSFVLVAWLRQFTLIFGNHTVSMICLLLALFSCFALGSFITGKLADKIKNPLKLFLYLTVAFTLYVLLQSVLFEWAKSLYFKTVTAYNPGGLGIGITIFFFSFVFFLFPASVITGSIPLLVRHYIRNVSQSGRFMSASIFSVTTGLLAGILISVFLIIPVSGIRGMFFSGVCSNILIIAVTQFYIYRTKKKESTGNLFVKSEKKKTSIRFKKKAIVLEAGAKLTRAMLYGSLFQSFSFASMVILGLRILLKYNTLRQPLFYVVTFGIILSGLALGSLLYKGIAEKPANKYLTLATLQISAGFLCMLAYALFHLTVNTIYNQLSKVTSFSGLIGREILLFSMLLLIPAILHGISFPLVGRLYPKRIQHIGKTFGQLGGLIFLSTVAGIVITPLFLIPFLGIQPAYIFLALLTLLSGIYLIFRDSRLIRGFRLGYAFLALILFLIVAGTFRVFNINQSERLADRIIEGRASSVSFVENNDKTKSVFLNGAFYFGSDANGRKEQVLSACIPAFINPNIQSALVMGFGTGITASVLNEHNVSSIVITEEFPEVVRLSSDIFADENNDIITGTPVDISIEDFRSYLLRTDRQFDLIVSGADQIMKFPGKYTVDLYRICFNKLSEKGLLCQMIPMNINRKEFLALCRANAEVFRHLSLWYLSPEKMLLVSSKTRFAVDPCNISVEFTSLKRISSLIAIGIPDPATLLAHYMMNNEQIVDLSADAIPPTDNNPLAEFNRVIPGKENEILPLLEETSGDMRFPEAEKSCPTDTLTVLRRINEINQSLLQQVSRSFSKKWHVVDFFEANGSLIQLYL